MPNSRNQAENRFRRLELIVLLLGVIFHCATLNHQSYFVDEVAELNSAHNTWQWTIWRTDSMPPLYPILLKSWVELWGTDGAGRWFSVICSVLAATIASRFSTSWLGPRFGLWVLALMLANPLNIYYAQWTRGYALMLLWATLSIGAFINGCRTGKTFDWAMFALATVFGIYTHYYFVMVTWSLLLGWLIQRHYLRWKSVVGWTMLAAIACLPVIAFLKADFQYQKAIRDPRPLSVPAVGYTYFSLFSGFAFGPSHSELHALPIKQALEQVLPAGCALLLCALPLLFSGCRELLRLRWMPTWACLFALPLVLIGMLGALTGITYNVRFVCWMTAPLSICLALGICQPCVSSAGSCGTQSRIGGRSFAPWINWRTTAGFAMLAFMIIANCNRLIYAKYQFEDIRSAAAYIRSHAEPHETVFVVSDYMVEPVRYYLQGAIPAIELPTLGVWSVVFQDDSTVEQAAMNIQRNADGKFWFIYSREYHGDPQGRLLRNLEHGFGLTEVAIYAGVRVFTGQTSIE